MSITTKRTTIAPARLLAGRRGAVPRRMAATFLIAATGVVSAVSISPVSGRRLSPVLYFRAPQSRALEPSSRLRRCEPGELAGGLGG